MVMDKKTEILGKISHFNLWYTVNDPSTKHETLRIYSKGYSVLFTITVDMLNKLNSKLMRKSYGYDETQNRDP